MAQLVKRRSKLTKKVSWVTVLRKKDVGRLVRISHGQCTAEEAGVMHAEIVLAVGRHGSDALAALQARKRGRTLDAAWRDMIAARRLDGATPHTLRLYDIRRRRVGDVIGLQTPVNAIKADDGKRLAAARLAVAKPRTVQAEVSSLWAVLRQEHEAGRLLAVPRRPSLARALRSYVDANPPDILTPAEGAAIARELSPELRHQWLLALYTGVRRDEIARLEWSRVDLGQAHVVFVDVKTGKPKPIALRTEAADALRQQREELMRTGRMGQWVFPGRDGSKPRSQWSRQLRAAAQRAGVERRVWLHLARITVTSELLSAGFATTQVRDIMGWTSTAMVDRYARSKSADIERAFDSLPTLDLDGGKVREFKR